jgi:hypothetical protein
MCILRWKTAPAFEERPEESDATQSTGASAAHVGRRQRRGDHAM